MIRPPTRTLCLAFAAATVLALLSDVADAQNRRQPRRRPGRAPDRLQQGDAAPDFTLKSLDGKSTVELSSFRGNKPVALIFGSYT